MKLTNAQLVARLYYAANVCAWGNVHPEMKPAMRGLIKRGLAERWGEANAFGLTEQGEEILNANKSLLIGGCHDDAGAYVPVVIDGAKYWTDQWQQQIPA
jgi:hypothetical protein